MERGFKYRIYPNESQRDQIARTFGCCRFVYNRALDVKKTAYSETGKSIATNDLIKMIPAWKRDPETSWLAQVDSMALQQSIRDLDRAYKNFFRRVREGGKPGFPKFKSRRHARQSYRTNGGKVLDRNHIALPKLGTVRAKVSRPLQGRFMSVTVSLDAAGRYFATFLCTDVPSKDTTMLADENQVLCMEDLNAKGMVRNRRLAKAVSDASFGEFARLLEYKCAERGRTLVRVDRFYPSSKTCSACGHRLDALPLSVRSWDCPACGAHHDRDVNAARNILTEGKRILSNTEGTAGHAGTVAAVVA